MIHRVSGGRPALAVFQKAARQPAKAAINTKQKAALPKLNRPLSAEAARLPGAARQATSERIDVPNRQALGAGAISRQDSAVAPVDPLSVLRDAMQKAGISGNVELKISDEMVQFPGGGYRNHQIQANFGNGVTESYSVDLMLKNPWLAAAEMKRLMGGITS